MKSSAAQIKRRILAARREIPADLVLKQGRVVNVFSGSVRENDVAVKDGYIVGIGPDYRGEEEADAKGKWITPGLIDGHIHIESSMLLPSHLASALVVCGTTTLVADPHEIANVQGLEGIRFMLRESRNLPVDFFFTAPSCVPASHMETSGAELKASDLTLLKGEPGILGLAEMMNYPGVLMGQESVLEKMALFEGGVIDGHCPALGGYDLQAYLAAGIRSDHETSIFEEGLEKLESGMMLMIREGTSARNLDALLPLVTEGNSRRFCFASDDLHPQDILRRGHLNHMVKRALVAGMNPVTALQLATLNPAEYFGLKDRGAVAPGFKADLVVLDDLDGFKINRVYKNGGLEVKEGRLVGHSRAATGVIEPRPLNLASPKPEDFRIRVTGTRARIIQLIPGQILTEAAHEEVTAADGFFRADIDRDILILAVAERHRGTGGMGLGLVRGFGLRRGAMASSVAHDSHNVISVGVQEGDLARAVLEVKNMGGGMVVVSEGEILARTPLPVGGLMSAEPLERLTEQLETLEIAAASLGCRIRDPFMTLSFLALPVIPELKLTDRGLVDVYRFSIVPIFTEEGQC